MTASDAGLSRFHLPDPPRKAAELVSQTTLTPRARARLRPGMLVRDYFTALVEARLYPDAVRLAAAGLPPRAAVWWACLCVRHTLAADAPPAHRAALDAAVWWVREPTAGRRKAAGAAADAAGVTCAAGCAARAAFWGGSSAKEGEPPRVEQPKALAKLAGAAVLLAVMAGKPADVMYRQFLLVGIDVLTHPDHWDGGRPE